MLQFLQKYGGIIKDKLQSKTVVAEDSDRSDESNRLTFELEFHHTLAKDLTNTYVNDSAQALLPAFEEHQKVRTKSVRLSLEDKAFLFKHQHTLAYLISHCIMSKDVRAGDMVSPGLLTKTYLVTP